MSKIGIFFGPLKGSVNRVADMIRDKIGAEKVEMVHVKTATPDDFKRFDKIIFGISTVGKETWDASISKTDWGIFLTRNKQRRFFRENRSHFRPWQPCYLCFEFCRFMGLLARELMKTEARIVGQVPTDDYEFEESAAIFDGKFIGLPLDEDFEPELTPERVDNWLETLKNEFNF
jgi:flavodoxin I